MRRARRGISPLTVEVESRSPGPERTRSPHMTAGPGHVSQRESTGPGRLAPGRGSIGTLLWDIPGDTQQTDPPQIASDLHI